jgi:hypothetical protein
MLLNAGQRGHAVVVCGVALLCFLLPQLNGRPEINVSFICLRTGVNHLAGENVAKQKFVMYLLLRTDSVNASGGNTGTHGNILCQLDVRMSRTQFTRQGCYQHICHATYIV